MYSVVHSSILRFSFSSSGPNRGHYITIVKSHGFWLLFDDDIVEVSMLEVMGTTFVLIFASLLEIKILIQNWVEITSLQSHSLVVMFIPAMLGRKVVNKVMNPVVCALSVLEGYLFHSNIKCS